jgi:MFS family permease
MPDEDEEEAEDNDMSRSNMSIGIVSSLINVGNGVQPLIVGVILDRFKVQTDGAEENFKAGIKKVNLLMCVLDGVAAVTLLVWLVLKPEMINWRKPETTTESKSD